MLIISSLSPSHINSDLQNLCSLSWSRFGDVYCLQADGEAEGLKSTYAHVKFISTLRTTKGLLNKPLVSINAMIDQGKKKKESVLLINSDILLKDLPELNQDGVTVFQRNDYTLSYDDGVNFQNGYDAFYIPEKLLHIFPLSIYAMGACWWDYWIPYRAIRNNIPVYLNSSSAFHKKHNIQWQQKEWEFFGRYFGLENNLPHRDIGQMGLFVLNTIKRYLK